MGYAKVSGSQYKIKIKEAPGKPELVNILLKKGGILIDIGLDTIFQASELLFFNTKITAAQAHEWGLVSQVFPQDRFQTEAWNKVKQVADLPVKVS
jgi:hypothetical protein